MMLRATFALVVAACAAPALAQAQDGHWTKRLRPAPVAQVLETTKQRVQTVRLRLAGQRESASAANARGMECRRLSKDAARPAGTRMNAYRECLSRG